MIKTKTKFNSSLTFLIAIINTILLFAFLIEISNHENQFLFIFNLFWVVVAIQLFLIAYFDASKNKKTFKILGIIAVVISLLVALGIAFLTGLGAAFQH
ncbi:hypothetical protein M4I21_11890 [Cellulophaga sp. 20_2_10]|uniref:hypothetical protein n=1 Tax=Cellulophaga sp. 20_2_10 TaxID=2942476 RepID=UPI00201A73BA|nr:hypothetical protein [Cellulophaga sp. 20_2_10]MCL5246516.1 hypothetical protein [Cellulophaga sp. 20_2_10]